jgi:predicted  nucleic acid-binding Zn-ribbon protein
MMFQDFDLKTKKLLLLFLSCLLCWWLFSASATASASGMPEPTYTITETELTQLENNISTLKSINDRLQTDLRAQSNEATMLRKELNALRKELSDLKQQSMMQESSLTNANRLLEEYATEAKRTRLRIKAQRNGWAAAAACLAIALAVK